MANQRTFTDEEVLVAAKQLQEEGKNVTANALRRIVGKGRPNTLFETYAELLAKGEAQQASTEVDQVVVMSSYELPTELAENLEAAKGNLDSVFKLAYDMAMHTVETRLNRAMQEAKDAKIQSEELVEQAEKNESAAYDEEDTQRIGREDAETKLATSLEREADLQAKLKNINEEYSKQVSEIEAMQEQLKTLEVSVRKAEASHRVTSEKLTKTTANLESTFEEIKHKKAMFTELNNELRKRDQENGRLNEKNKALTEQVAVVLEEVEQLKKPKPSRSRKTASNEAK